ncbi:hypothetical protein B7486_67960, partial [cyanobacterium TDX16]
GQDPFALVGEGSGFGWRQHAGHGVPALLGEPARGLRVERTVLEQVRPAGRVTAFGLPLS